ncbi:hypothetical protein [Azospirillum sp. sgz302134]
MQYPNELTPALMDALGMMNFQTGPIAHIYRAAGHDIPRKCEAEQAFVLHRCVLLALEHGEDWRSHAQAELDRMKEQIAASAQTTTAPAGA